jgi:hypothetical protein
MITIIEIWIGSAFLYLLCLMTPSGKKWMAEQRKIEQERLIRKEKQAQIVRMIAKLKNYSLRLNRDADNQELPYIYKCNGHPNVTLAIRYGVANLQTDGHKYWAANKIQLQKIKKVKDDPEGSHYLAKLTNFGNREVVVVIKPGTEYVQTFYPKSEDWFKKYADLELVLKDNKTFDLKELANFHVQKVVINS